MANEADTFLREVQADLQRERFFGVVRRYGLPLGAIAAVGIALGGGYALWNKRQEARLLTANLSFEQALETAAKGQTDNAAALLRQLSQDQAGGYSSLAALMLASKNTADVNSYAALVAAPETDPLLRDLAAVLAGYRATGPLPGAVRAHLASLGDASGPWQFMAREAMIINDLASGLPEQARTKLTTLLADPGVPPSVAMRVKALAASLPSSAEPPAASRP